MRINPKKTNFKYASFGYKECNLSPNKRFEYLEEIKRKNLNRISSSFDKRLARVKDNQGNEVEGIILEEKNEEDGYEYSMYRKDGSEMGKVQFVIGKSSIYITSLNADYRSYNGIGTELVKSVIKKGLDYGIKKIYVDASNEQEYDVCRYRRSISPIPFYYKLGFRSSDEKKDALIKTGMKSLEKYGFYSGPLKDYMRLDISGAE